METFMSKVLKWIKKHVRPTFGFNEKANWKQDEFSNIVKEAKKNAKIGFKINLKF